jgi:hypothetical protein
MSINFLDEGQVAEAQADLAESREIQTSVTDCAACGGVHNLTFSKLKTPATDGTIPVTHVAICPTNGIQLKLTWPPPLEIVAREKATQLAEAGQQLHIDGMSKAEIQKVLNALRES